MNEVPDTYLADFGVPVVWGAVSGIGILDQPDVLIADGLAIGTAYQLTAKASVFGTAANGSAFLVNGVAFTVREVKKVDDGIFVRIGLELT